MNYTIRKLSATDTDLGLDLIRLFNEEWDVTDNAAPGRDYIARMLCSHTFHVFVALAGNTVVGGVTAYELIMFNSEQSEMFLYDLAVHEQHRQHGLATRLIEALKQTCATRGIKTMFVGTSKDDKAAIALYNRTGGDMEEIPWFTYEL